MEVLKYQDTIRFVTHLTKLTEKNDIIWQSKLVIDKIQYYTSIPNTSIRIILYNLDSVPTIFVRTEDGVKQLILKGVEYIHETTQPAEKAAIELVVAVSNQIFQKEIKHINRKIMSYLDDF